VYDVKRDKIDTSYTHVYDVKRDKIDTPDTHVYDVKRDKIDTPYTHVYDVSLSWRSTDTSIKRVGSKLVYVQTLQYKELGVS
jgi:hypothetical protein